MGQESIFSEAGRRIMVKAPSEAVRPSLNVTIQGENNEKSLSHHGETESYVKSSNEQERSNKHEEQSSSSTSKKMIRSGTDRDQGGEREDEERGGER